MDMLGLTIWHVPVLMTRDPEIKCWLLLFTFDDQKLVTNTESKLTYIFIYEKEIS